MARERAPAALEYGTRMIVGSLVLCNVSWVEVIRDIRGYP